MLLDVVSLSQGKHFFPYFQLLQNLLQHMFFSNVPVIPPNGINYNRNSIVYCTTRCHTTYSNIKQLGSTLDHFMSYPMQLMPSYL